MENFLRKAWRAASRHRGWKTILSVTSRINPAPIIILGNQKSGTTAITALLAKHAGMSVTLDIPGIWEPVETRIHIGDITLEEFVRRNKFDFSRDIIKEPCLTFLYPDLRSVFPRARFVMIVRDPRDNIRSILNRLNIRGDLEDIDEKTFSNIPPAWRLVVDGQYLRLQGSTYIERLAARWNRAMDIYLNHSSEMILVRYEDFLTDKPGTIQRVSRELGLREANDITNEIDVQYQRPGNRSISWKEFFGQENLTRIERFCGSRMNEFGYVCSHTSMLRGINVG
jgi:hypothetical protein